MMYRFHVCLHACPREATVGETVVCEGRPVATLAVPPAALGAPMGVSFEQAGEALAALPRMFFEPDGSFVWVSSGEPRWQVDGCLYDRGGKLLYVDLKGACPGEEFDRLLRACGWPHTPLVFQLVRQAVFLSEDEFRRISQRDD